jgi:hypothetical protein
VLLEVEDQESNLVNQYFKDRGLDQKTFSHFIFDYHFKHQVEVEANMEERHGHNFLLFLNSFMNNVTFKNMNFEKSLFKNFLMSEISLSWTMHSTGKLYGEELKTLKKSLVTSASDLAYQLDEFSLLVNDESYFCPTYLEKG